MCSVLSSATHEANPGEVQIERRSIADNSDGLRAVNTNQLRPKGNLTVESVPSIQWLFPTLQACFLFSSPCRQAGLSYYIQQVLVLDQLLYDPRGYLQDICNDSAKRLRNG